MAADSSDQSVSPASPDVLRAEWADWAVNAYVAAGIVALLTWVGFAILVNGITSDVDGMAVVFGSLLLGLAAGVAVLGVLLTLRRAMLRSPPAEPRSPGKVEV